MDVSRVKPETHERLVHSIGAVPEPERPPVANQSLEARNFTLDYLERCRQAVVPGRPAHLRQHGRPADQRQVLAADLRRQGRAAAPGDPSPGRHLHPRETLQEWIRNPFGARPDYLPVSLQAIGERLSSPQRR